MNNQAQVQIDNALSSPRRRFGKVFVIVGSTIATAANAAIDISQVTTLVGEGVVAAGVLGVAYLAFSGGIAIFNRLKSAAK